MWAEPLNGQEPPAWAGARKRLVFASSDQMTTDVLGFLTLAAGATSNWTRWPSSSVL